MQQDWDELSQISAVAAQLYRHDPGQGIAAAAGDAITPAELEEAIRRLCQQHGAKWPRGWGADLARRAGVSKQAVSQRKAAVLAAMAGVG